MKFSEPITGALLGAVLDAWAVLSPVDCSGCGAPDRGLCPVCRVALAASVHVSTRDDVAVWSALDYSGVARRVIGAYKDGGRTDAAKALAAPLREAVVAALAHAPPHARTVHLVTIPSSRTAWRIRGFHPVELMLKRGGLAASEVLRPAVLRTGTQSVDQVGLGAIGRRQNKRGSLVARRSLEGFCCLVVDDIVTTGATLLEARRALVAAGADVLGMVTLAETRRRHPVV
ncbi:ComF family protein [Glaciibacter superstes]|uniref:ComF family protein n=1 Tax=Glaciibacter superstes TaxID=501023 RepID=UPI0003B4CE3E|nr:phosphoribosyltransferase family protein [Glaciibacter superstes]